MTLDPLLDRVVDRLRNFKRTAKLTAYRTTTPLFGEDYVVERDKGVNGIEITDLRIEFDIQRDLSKHPNRCNIKITNLAKHTRAAFERKPLKLELSAGYDGVARLMYVGDLQFGMSRMERPNWVTSLQVRDGLRAYSNARVSRSYTAGTQLKRVLSDVVKSLGQTLPRNIETSPELEAQFGTGVVVFGAARDELTRLLAPYGYSWSFQNGKIQILKDEEVFGNEFEISEAAGMIGSPEFGTPTKAGKPPRATITTLLYPELRPGAKAKVRASNLNGTFRIEEVRHRGDTHGDAWHTEVEVKLK